MGAFQPAEKNGFLFNHGAQFVTARGNKFSALLADARNAGSLKDWRINPEKTVQIGAPSMRDLPQFMARGIEIRQQVEVTNIAHIGPNIGFFNDAGLIACGRQAIVSAPCTPISPFADKRVSRSCCNR